MTIDIKRITWWEALPVRHEVLWPQRELAFCQVEGDEEAWHFGGFVDGKLVSVASIYPNRKACRLRKFATLAEYQGRGLGSALLTVAMDTAMQAGADYFWCDARESAVAFYRRFGMEPEGARFFKAHIPYVKMGRRLTP